MAEGWERGYQRDALDQVVFTYMVRITKVLVSRVLFDQLTCLLPWHSECYLEGDNTHTHTPNHIKLLVVCHITYAISQLSSFYEEWKCNIEIVEKS